MSGLVINPEYSWLGASPDSIVRDPSCNDPNGGLEIKGPYNYCDKHPFSSSSPDGLLLVVRNGKLVLREHHHCYYQARTDGYLL